MSWATWLWDPILIVRLVGLAFFLVAWAHTSRPGYMKESTGVFYLLGGTVSVFLVTGILPGIVFSFAIYYALVKYNKMESPYSIVAIGEREGEREVVVHSGFKGQNITMRGPKNE